VGDLGDLPPRFEWGTRPSAVAEGTDETDHSCSHEEQGGGFGRACIGGRLGGDGQFEVDWATLRRDVVVLQGEGAGCEKRGVDEVAGRAGLREWGDEHRTSEKKAGGGGDVREGEAIAGRADAGEEGDVEGLACDAVGGAGGLDERNGDEVKLIGEGELGGQGEDEGVGVAGERGVEGVGVGGNGKNSGGEDEELGEEVTHEISLRGDMRALV
jgi:hypothetical protein